MITSAWDNNAQEVSKGDQDSNIPKSTCDRALLFKARKYG